VRERYHDTNYVTGLRAFAALGVVLIHSGGAGLAELSDFGRNIVALGASGVFVFFVISGFSVSASFETSAGYGDYLTRRIVRRIIPLYYFWLAVCIAMASAGTVSLYSVLMHVTFLNVFDYTVANSILWVEWTIAVEVFFYLLVPFALRWASSGWRLIVLVAGGYALNRSAFHVFETLGASWFADPQLALWFSPFPYALCFALGVTAYRLRQWYGQSALASDCVLLSAVAIALLHAASPALLTGYWFDELMLVSLLTFSVVAFGSDRGAVTAALLCNPVAQYLGLISYGLYLSHLPLIRWFVQSGKMSLPLQFAAAVALAVAAATVTYFLIEKPLKGRSGRQKANAASGH
jgi:peptidoglycan/LPS O-acetylase OafA/YrhL